MQQLTDQPKNRYPLECIKVIDFMRMSESKRFESVVLRTKAINEFLHQKFGDNFSELKIGKNPTSEKYIRYLNRMIRSIRGDPLTETEIVIELFEELIQINGKDYRSAYNDIHTALEIVPAPSIRRILSQYRNGKLG